MSSELDGDVVGWVGVCGVFGMGVGGVRVRDGSCGGSGCVGDGDGLQSDWMLLGDDCVWLDGSDVVLESEKSIMGVLLRFELESLVLDVGAGLVGRLRLLALAIWSRVCWLVTGVVLEVSREWVFCEDARAGCANPPLSPI